MAYSNIKDSSEHFHTQLYTGNGTAIGSGGNAITNNANSGNFKPDWTWHKVRSTANDHQVYDSSRGVKIRLNPNATNSDFTLNEGLQSFDTNGFTVGSDGGVNSNSQTYVAWQWKANGGTTASNTSGSITSTVQANTDAGFSIVTFTGTGATTTVGHGLGVKPSLHIIKNRSSSGNWFTYTSVIDGSLDFLYLNTSGAKIDSGLSAPTTSVFTVNSTTAPNTDTIIAYCFAEKQGFSKVGSYTGNGSADGAFIYTGFRPAWVMTKKDGTSGWFIQDIKRGIRNSTSGTALEANSNYVEADIGATGYDIDFLSNGFKHRQSNTYTNASGSKYIYMAFAEHPFVAGGIPTTAR